MNGKTFEVRGMTHAMNAVSVTSHVSKLSFYETLLASCEGMDTEDAWLFLELFAGQ